MHSFLGEHQLEWKYISYLDPWFLSWPSRKWRSILWGLMEKHGRVWVLYSAKIAFRYEGEGKGIFQMKRNTEN